MSTVLASGRRPVKADRCPPTPQSETVEALGFTPRPMVNWLHPLQLLETGVRVLFASIVGGLIDRREIQAALAASAVAAPRQDRDSTGLVADQHDYSDRPELWFDFTADLGDGFASTYTVAWMLSREALTVGESPSHLPRGRFLVLGGDQAYPRASREEYKDRFAGPYRAALPFVAVSPPHLYAIPGNHDWYDGLASFLKLFCQGRWVGGWKTQQTRSYFSIRLPNGWWLWGVDVQLESDIDKPQIDYFSAVAARMEREAAACGETPRLILCTGEPTWVASPGRDAEAAFKNLAYFEQEVIARHGIRLELTIAGNHHHYARYERIGPQDTSGKMTPGRLAPFGSGDVRLAEGAPAQRVTSGGGGAYANATHWLPDTIELQDTTGDAGAPSSVYARRVTFPSPGESQRLLAGVATIPWRNLPFALLVGGIYLLFSWILQSASKAVGQSGTSISLMEALSVIAWSWSGVAEAAAQFWIALRHSPSAVVFAAAVLYGLALFRRSAGGGFVAGVAHGAAHLALSAGLMWLWAWVNLGVLGLRLESAPQFLLFAAEMFVAGGAVGTLLYASYLWLSSLISGCHLEVAFSAQRLEDFKHILRLHIGVDGALTCYALGVRHVPRRRDWRLDRSAGNGAAWFTPAAGVTVQEVDRFTVR